MEKTDARKMQVTDDLHKLLMIIPEPLRVKLEGHSQLDNLIEIVMDLGRLPEARFLQKVEYLSDVPISRSDLEYSISRVGHFSSDNRAGIECTLHRISAIRNRSNEIIGLTCRVGRSVFGTIGLIRDLVETGRSILMLGRPGVGKTTALREVARVLADDLGKRVVIIDTSNEIAGDGDIPHPAIGRARRMQVARPELQHQVMIEAVENHTPEVIVIDEIGTELEALAARTIAERGVQLVGTAHGNRIENLVKNPTLSDLVGGIQAVTLGDDEAKRRGSQKTVLERKAPPTFEIAVEMLERYRWVVHEQVADTVDALLRQKQHQLQVRAMDETGTVTITHEKSLLPVTADNYSNNIIRTTADINFPVVEGLRASGYMRPLTVRDNNLRGAKSGESDRSKEGADRDFAQMLDASFPVEDAWDNLSTRRGPNGEDLPLHVYPYGITRQQMEQVIQALSLPVVITKDLDDADVVLAERSQSRKQSKLRHAAKNRHLPIHVIKNTSPPQIARALRRLLDMDDPATPEIADFSLFMPTGSDDEMEALEEARLAVEQIVIPKGQPVELLPRSAKIRKIQHELIEHYRLKSVSFGEEPQRRLRIYPA